VSTTLSPTQFVPLPDEGDDEPQDVPSAAAAVERTRHQYQQHSPSPALFEDLPYQQHHQQQQQQQSLYAAGAPHLLPPPPPTDVSEHHARGQIQAA
jgi:hypothetical protein